MEYYDFAFSFASVLNFLAITKKLFKNQCICVILGLV